MLCQGSRQTPSPIATLPRDISNHKALSMWKPWQYERLLQRYTSMPMKTCKMCCQAEPSQPSRAFHEAEGLIGKVNVTCGISARGKAHPQGTSTELKGTLESWKVGLPLSLPSPYSAGCHGMETPRTAPRSLQSELGRLCGHQGTVVVVHALSKQRNDVSFMRHFCKGFLNCRTPEPKL